MTLTTHQQITSESVDKIKHIISQPSETIAKELIDIIIPYGLIRKEVDEVVLVVNSKGKNLELKEKFEEAARSCAYKNISDPVWGLLGGRLECCRLYCTTANDIYECTQFSGDYFHPDYINMARDVSLKLKTLDERDFRHDYFSIKTLEKSYLLRKIEGKNTITVETPQQLWLRVATWLWYPDINKINKTYQDLSQGNYVHASPTLFNSGLSHPMLTSCFLLTIDDSMESIARGWHDCAMISKNGGGIGIDVSRLRHGPIRGTGMSSGLVGALKVYNEVMHYSDQSGKRLGSATIFCPPWHKDVFGFIDMKKTSGPEDIRARGLFYALWISDLFMKRVEQGKKWSLFCPNEAPGLSDVYGEEFEKLYNKHENEGKADRVIDAQELWQSIILSQQETGGPFMVYKDASNHKSNQNNLGTIKSSNLCVEIIEYSDNDQIASCNLASVGLDTCVVVEQKRYDFRKLQRLVRDLIRNINQVIDRNYYPESVPQVKRSNLKHRPIGIGVHGLADTFALMDLCWDSDEAKTLNKQIFETMYYAFISESCEIAIEKGCTYESFEGSLTSKGIFQFDLWKETVLNESLNYDWHSLKEKVKKHGLYNSLGIALMPTASSAQINGKNESFEMFTSNLYSRSVLSGQFMMVNKHLVRDLKEIDKWNENIVDHLLTSGGSIKTFPNPFDYSDKNYERFEYIRKKYATIWETSQKLMIDMSADRGPFVCQSQSFNCFMKDPTYQKLTSFHFYGWKRGLKTGMYYLRSVPATLPVNYAFESQKQRETEKQKETKCNDDVCVMCSS